MSQSELNAFIEKFRVEELCVLRIKHWSWSVRPAQPTLGSSVLSLNRYAAEFSDLSPAELTDMAITIKAIELGTKKAFGYDKINYLMLMMVDPHVHFHVIPRYSEPQTFDGRTYADAGWPLVPNLAADPQSDESLLSIRNTLVSTL